MSYNSDNSNHSNGYNVNQCRRPYQSEALTTRNETTVREGDDENFSIASYLIQQLFGVCAADFQSKAMMPSTLQDIHDEILSIDYDADDGIVVRGSHHNIDNNNSKVSSVHDYSYYNHYNYNHEGASTEYYDVDFDDENTLLANCTKQFNKHDYDYDDLDSIISRNRHEYYTSPSKLYEVSQEESKEEDSDDDDESLLADSNDDNVPDYQFDSNRLATTCHRHHDRPSLLLSKTSSSNVETKEALPRKQNVEKSITPTQNNKAHAVEPEAPITPTRPVLSSTTVEDDEGMLSQTRLSSTRLSSTRIGSSVRLASE